MKMVRLVRSALEPPTHSYPFHRRLKVSQPKGVSVVRRSGSLVVDPIAVRNLLCISRSSLLWRRWRSRDSSPTLGVFSTVSSTNSSCSSGRRRTTSVADCCWMRCWTRWVLRRIAPNFSTFGQPCRAYGNFRHSTIGTVQSFQTKI